MARLLVSALLLTGCVGLAARQEPGPAPTGAFDHGYAGYAALLRQHLAGARVDYRALAGNRRALDEVVRAFAEVDREAEARWSGPYRLAFWINAYNVFTIRAIVDHYPIQGSWFSLYPRNSIRQIGGVWDRLRWTAAGRSLTLDEIEHQVLRPTFRDARIHFAVNCASVSCPPLALAPYRGDALERQLDDAARRFLSSDLGLRVEGATIRVSSIFKWYGGDFVARFAPLGPAGARTDLERAILGVVLTYGPPPAVAIVRQGGARLAFLDYDWSLNDTAPSS
jgi:hypothetical protein